MAILCELVLGLGCVWVAAVILINSSGTIKQCLIILPPSINILPPSLISILIDIDLPTYSLFSLKRIYSTRQRFSRPTMESWLIYSSSQLV